MQAFVSLREFARQRGVTLAAVQKAIESGRVTAVRRSESGRLKGIDLIAGTEQWNARTDPAQAARSETMLGAPAGSPAGALDELPLGDAPPAPEGASAPAKPGDDKDDYYRHRARREQIAAQQAELDYLKAIGSLVSADEARQVAERRYRTVRDAVLAVADQEAQILAAEKDPLVVRDRLTRSLKKALHELSDAARAGAARGAEERLGA